MPNNSSRFPRIYCNKDAQVGRSSETVQLIPFRQKLCNPLPPPTLERKDISKYKVVKEVEKIWYLMHLPDSVPIFSLFTALLSLISLLRKCLFEFPCAKIGARSQWLRFWTSGHIFDLFERPKRCTNSIHKSIFGTRFTKSSKLLKWRIFINFH